MWPSAEPHPMQVRSCTWGGGGKLPSPRLQGRLRGVPGAPVAPTISSTAFFSILPHPTGHGPTYLLVNPTVLGEVPFVTLIKSRKPPG